MASAIALWSCQLTKEGLHALVSGPIESNGQHHDIIVFQGFGYPQYGRAPDFGSALLLDTAQAEPAFSRSKD
jgi:hypothetical protein